MKTKVFLFYNEHDYFENLSVFNALVIQETEDGLIYKTVTANTLKNIIHRLEKVVDGETECMLINADSLRTASISNLEDYLVD